MNLRTQILSYTSVNIINAAVPFLLLPILTRYLPPSDYGVLSLIQLLMVVSFPVMVMNTHGLLTVEYAKLTAESFSRLFSTIVWIPVFGFIFLEALFLLFKDFISLHFHIPGEYIYFIPFFVLFQTIPTVIPILFQAKQEPLNFGKYKISMTVANLILSLMFVVVFECGWEGRLLGIVLSFIIFTIVGLVILFRLNLLVFAIDKHFLKEALSFGMPLIPHSIAGTFLVMSDRIFLANMLDESSVGIYSVAFQVSSAVLIVMSSINQAWVPNLFERLNNKPTLDDKLNIVKQTYKIMFVMLLISVLFIITLPVVFDLFIDESYLQAKSLSVYIAIAFLFQGFYFMVTNYILYSKKTMLLSYITTVSVVVVVISNYLLIQMYGVYGSAYSMILVWVFQFFVVFYVSSKVYLMPWGLR